jgi:hypothetical protein
MWIGCLRTAAVTLLLVLGLAPMARAHDVSGAGDPGDVTHRDTLSELADADISRTLATGSLTSRSTAALPQSLPTTWCGSRRVTDDAAHAVFPSSSAQIKLVYAYASDRPDDSALWSDSLQGDVSRIEQYLALQSGGRRALRFDMGNECGPQYVDIQVVALPNVRSYYRDNFSRVASAVRARVDYSQGPRNVFIVADDLTDSDVYGTGEVLPTADQAGPANTHNAGDFAAIMWARASTTPDATGRQPTVALHEMTHNLGGVAWSAPHTTHKDGESAQYSHCWDGEDVMCYPDGSNMAHAYDASICPQAAGAIPQTFDCGHDDYYNPAPAAGSYLASHWNVYDSDFMASCTELQTACGADVVPTPPVNQGAPGVTGAAARRGVALTASMGTWLNTPTSYTARWQRVVGTVWVDIAGANVGSYVPTSADVGSPLRVIVTAANADGAALAASAPTAPIAEVPTVVAQPQPTLTVRIRLRDRKRRTAGTLTAKLRRITAAREVKTTARRVTLRAGTWRLRLCAGPVRGSVRCTLTARVHAKGRIVRLPGARVVARTKGKVRVTAAVVDGRRRVRARGQAASV